MPRDREANRLPCVFSLALARRLAVCEWASTQPEQGAPTCASPVARLACARLNGMLREHAAFVLKLRPAQSGRLPGSAATKIQCGGLLGVQEILDPGAPAPDVQRLVHLLQLRAGGLGSLPVQPLLRRIAAWRDVHLER